MSPKGQAAYCVRLMFIFFESRIWIRITSQKKKKKLDSNSFTWMEFGMLIMGKCYPRLLGFDLTEIEKNSIYILVVLG